MRLAKGCLDVGLYTDRSDEQRRFYVDELGLPYEELLRIGSGVRQHRLGLLGSVLKLNDSRAPLDDAPTNFVRLDIRGGTEQHRRDVDGTEVVVRPDLDAIAVHWASRDPGALARLLRDGFDAVAAGGHGDESWWQVGSTRLVLRPGGSLVGPLRSRGFRYLTVQVWDVRAEHARLLELGWQEGMPPTLLGETAYISFVLDPDGAPIEVSQRASLTGPLPSV